MENVKPIRKFTVCLLAGLLCAAVISRLLARYFIDWIPITAIWAIALLCFFACLEYAILWQQQEKKGKGNSQTKLAFFNALIGYSLAFDLASFGWQKICHLQMVVPLGILDLPFNRLDGETLTWAYFRRSYPFTVSIAICQISSAYLLLWPRTRLMALICMIPILLNIILIDIFYHLHPGVLVHAIILALSVLYLLMQYYLPLKTFFFQTLHISVFVPVSKRVTNILRVTVIIIPLILLATYAYPDKHPKFTGKYSVRHLLVNGQPVQVHSVKDSVLTTVYMDWLDDFALEFNHYNSRYIGTYHYNPGTDSLQVKWHYPDAFKMPFSGIFKQGNAKGVYLFHGKLGNDTISMTLEKVPEP